MSITLLVTSALVLRVMQALRLSKKFIHLHMLDVLLIREEQKLMMASAHAKLAIIKQKLLTFSLHAQQ